MEKRELIDSIFTDIHQEYDFLNHLMTFGQDLIWRRKAAHYLVGCRHVVDLCAGTGDMALALFSYPQFEGHITLVDANVQMLGVARRKLRYFVGQGRASFQAQDVERLDPGHSGADGFMLGFALRNLTSLERFARGLRRVSSDSSRIALLELAHPRLGPLNRLYYFYFYRLIPIFAPFFSKGRSAYEYLPESLRIFPEQAAIVACFKASGFGRTYSRNLSGGVSAIYYLRR